MSAEELADILEVIKALVVELKFTTEDIEEIRLKKEQSRGAFKKKIFLEYVNE